MACGLARVHLLVCGGRGYAAAVVPPSLVRPLRASQSPFPFALRLISIDPFFGLVGPYAAYGGRCQVPVISSWKGLPRPFARWDARSGVGGVRCPIQIRGLTSGARGLASVCLACRPHPRPLVGSKVGACVARRVSPFVTGVLHSLSYSWSSTGHSTGAGAPA